MIIETVTLSTVPTSLGVLVETARGGKDWDRRSATGVIIRNDSGADVYGSDKFTATPVLLTDSDQPFESHLASSIWETLLSAVDGTVVGLIISQ